MLRELIIINSFIFKLADSHSSSQAICAELAHEHAIEDLHQITDHVSDDNNPARGMFLQLMENTGLHILTKYLYEGPFFPQIYPQHTTEPKLDE